MNGTDGFFTIKGEQLITNISHEENIPSHKVCLDSQNNYFQVHIITKDDLVHEIYMETMTSKEDIVFPKESCQEDIKEPTNNYFEKELSVEDNDSDTLVNKVVKE